MKILRKFEKTLLLLLKLLLFAGLFFVFFGIFGINNSWLWRASRTTAVTMVTFVVTALLLMQIYGGYAIGVKKSKPIIHSMVFAAIFTDLLTHLMLSIMNTSENNNPYFVYETPHLLLLVMALQTLLIIAMTYFGNFVFFSVHAPEKCCIIASDSTDLNEFLPKVLKYEKQYRINDVAAYYDSDVLDIIAKNDTVFLCDVPIKERTAIMEYCYHIGKNIYYNFEMCDIITLGADNIILDDKPFVCSTVNELTIEQRFFKRLFDVIFSLIMLIITSPISLLSALAIKLEDGGSVLFRQKRATLGGKIFDVYKFRTMREEDSVNRSVTENDDRITRVGGVLRKFRIDELPQFLNILKGDMSIVGPRPEMIENVDKYTASLPEFAYRLRVKAGLTGLAQIEGKYNTVPRDKLVLDLMYIENYSLRKDIQIIFQTMMVFLKSSESTEAFRDGEALTIKKYNETKNNGG